MAHEKDSASSVQNPSLLVGLLGILSFVFGAWIFSKVRAPNKNSSETVRPQDTPSAEGQGGQSSPAGVLMVQAPTNASNSRNATKQERPWWEKVAVVIAFGLLIANWYQGCQTKRAADAAKDSLTTVQRAFISYEGINLDAYPVSLTSNDRAWVFTVNLENSGTTPAVDKIQEFWGTNDLSDEPTELEFLGPDNDHPIGEIGPRSKSNMGPLIKSSKFVMGKYPFTRESVASKEWRAFFHSERVFLWGWIGYRDVFAKTRPHVTEFCEELNGVAIGYNLSIPEKERFPEPRLNFKECKTHNCTDEHCEDYETIAAMVPK